MDNTVKIICYGIGGIVALYILMSMYPYIIMFLALVGAWHLYEHYNRHNGRKN